MSFLNDQEILYEKQFGFQKKKKKKHSTALTMISLIDSTEKALWNIRFSQWFFPS